MRRVWLVVTLTVGAGLALAVGSQARLSQAALKCGPGYARRSVRVPERKHGRLVRRHHKIVYTRVQRCVKVRKPPAPTTTTPQPNPGASGNPVTPPVDTPTTTTTTPTTPPPPAPPLKASPCSTPIPGATLQLGQTTYTMAGVDTFTKDAPVGSFAQASVPDASYLSPVYTGDYGMGWSVYPDGWPASYTATNVTAYQPSTVLSVHDGVLDFYLHDDATGTPVGANVSPWPGGTNYQTYGAYSFCEKVSMPGQLADFYQASLLWPQHSADGECAESDFPETYSPTNGGSLDAGVIYAFAHYGAWSAQTGCPSNWSQGSWHTSIDLSQWHVFTQAWGPGFRAYYIDGQLVYTTTTLVWSQPERWQLQMEPSPSSQIQKAGGSGHVYISWVWIGTPS